jgi:hypothetical protein
MRDPFLESFETLGVREMLALSPGLLELSGGGAGFGAGSLGKIEFETAASLFLLSGC